MNGEDGIHWREEPTERVIKPDFNDSTDEVVFKPEEIELQNSDDRTELQRLIEITEGGEVELEDGTHHLHNLRESLKHFQMEELSDYTMPSSPVRNMVLRRYGGPEKLEVVIRAYNEIYIPDLLEKIEEEFEEFERRNKQGLSDPTHFRLSKKVDSARLYVKYLQALKSTLDAENEALEKKSQSERWHQEIIEKGRSERKERGIAITKIFDEGNIKVYPRGEEKEISLIDYADKIGSKLTKDYYAQMNEEELKNTMTALLNFKRRLVELLPENTDRQLLLEEWEEKEKSILRELDELFRAKLNHKLSEKELSEIDDKKRELTKTQQVIRVLQRSTY